MTVTTHLWLRAETKPSERRTPITPETALLLIKENGFRITVEESKDRIFPTQEYADAGCEIAEFGSWKQAPADAFIFGLKELPENDSTPLVHDHIFFAHCFKRQQGWAELLKRFIDGKGTLYDLEFLNDEQGRRVAAFGFYAGFAGAAFGIDVWCHQQVTSPKARIRYPSLTPFANETELLFFIKTRLDAAVRAAGRYPKIMVMGALGRCGSGAVDLLIKAGIPESNILKWDLAETKKGGPFPEILESDIFINCIYLSTPIPPFLTMNMLKETLPSARPLSVIVDVSCDATNPHNPVPIYNRTTTFDDPLISLPDVGVDIVAIDHLPTLTPRESSLRYSLDLLPAMRVLGEARLNAPVARTWNNARDLFSGKCDEARKELGL